MQQPGQCGFAVKQDEHWHSWLQVSDLLERMTPAAARLDLQTSAFSDLLETHQLAKQPGAVCSTEPWCAALLCTAKCMLKAQGSFGSVYSKLHCAFTALKLFHDLRTGMHAQCEFSPCVGLVESRNAQQQIP